LQNIKQVFSPVICLGFGVWGPPMSGGRFGGVILVLRTSLSWWSEQNLVEIGTAVCAWKKDTGTNCLFYMYGYYFKILNHCKDCLALNFFFSWKMWFFCCMHIIKEIFSTKFNHCIKFEIIRKYINFKVQQHLVPKTVVFSFWPTAKLLTRIHLKMSICELLHSTIIDIWQIIFISLTNFLVWEEEN